MGTKRPLSFATDWVGQVVLRVGDPSIVRNDPALHPFGSLYCRQFDDVEVLEVAVLSWDRTMAVPTVHCDCAGMIYTRHAPGSLSFLADFNHFPYRSWPARLRGAGMHALITNIRKFIELWHGTSCLACIPHVDEKSSYLHKAGLLGFTPPTSREMQSWTCAYREIARQFSPSGLLDDPGIFLHDPVTNAALRQFLHKALQPRVVMMRYGTIQRPMTLEVAIRLFTDANIDLIR